MALFGQLTKPAKELPLIDVSNPDIVMELLEEVRHYRIDKRMD